MSAEFQPGDVAMLTWYADEPMVGLRVGGVCGHFGKADHWHTERGSHGITPDIARRLVVIDPEDAQQVERLYDLVEAAQSYDVLPFGASPEALNESLASALREFANPAPRIEEPQGLGAVVETTSHWRWVRTNSAPDRPWWRYPGITSAWSHIEATRVLSEGVTP